MMKILKALADETRLQIISLLIEHDFCVGALAGMLKISKAAVSQHLKLLREASLVIGNRRGYWMHYRVNRKVLRKAATCLQELADRQGDGSYDCRRTFSNREPDEKRILPMCKNCCAHPK
ncbi:MAG: metalloregulator ArsR/SmtB family transcription factor [Bacillota bacterium]